MTRTSDRPHTASDAIRLIGSRVYLRRVMPQDATLRYVEWLNDPETTRYLEIGPGTQTLSSVRRYIEKRVNDKNVLFLALMERRTGDHVGNLKLEPINWTDRSAVLGVLIGEPSARGRGYASEAIRLTAEYAFTRMRLHRIELGVAADHLAAIRCYEKVGFRVEGRLREAEWRDGSYVDSLWMGILERDLHLDDKA